MSNQTPYIGSKISLISKLDIRYEGILYTVDTNDSTIALAKVQSFGTEDRPTANPVSARDDVYEYIIFKASDIKDLIVCETPKAAPISQGLPYDPAIISVSSRSSGGAAAPPSGEQQASAGSSRSTPRGAAPNQQRAPGAGAPAGSNRGGQSSNVGPARGGRGRGGFSHPPIVDNRNSSDEEELYACAGFTDEDSAMEGLIAWRTHGYRPTVYVTGKDHDGLDEINGCSIYLCTNVDDEDDQQRALTIIGELSHVCNEENYPHYGNRIDRDSMNGMINRFLYEGSERKDNQRNGGDKSREQQYGFQLHQSDPSGYCTGWKATCIGNNHQVTDLGDLVEDSQFLNSLQTGVNRWIKEMRKVTHLDRDPASGTSLQEMTFWLNLERALLKINQKRESDEVILTLEALKCGKRFHATVSFDSDTGLKETRDKVSDVNQLMKDFPLNELVSATDMDGIRTAIGNVFQHMKKIRSTKYPVHRALRFVEAISRDVNAQILKVLGTRRLMHIAMNEFDQLMTQCFLLFTRWDDEYDKFIAILRDVAKKNRGEPVKLTWKVNPQHKKLEGRLSQLRQFRRQHEQLRTVIARVLRPIGSVKEENTDNGDEQTPVDQVNQAYEVVKEVECLDVSLEGTSAWDAALKRYEDQIERVETAITSRLRDQLGSARNANEMFSIFSRFNALFIRPHIRGAIREYQTQLIHRVKEDIEILQAKFTKHYSDKRGEILTPTFDIPPLSANIIWIKQIEHQLSLYMKRVEDVLGKGWENHVEGRQLKTEGDNFRQKLNTQPLFDSWSEQVQSKTMSAPGKVYVIERRPRDGKSVLHLKVNFSPESIVLHKEVRNLKNMGFRIPLKIVNAAHQANQLYPYAISLLESIKTYESINERLSGKKGIDILIASYKKEIQSQIAEGIVLTWESYKIDPYVGKLAETVNNYQERVEELISIVDKIEVDLAAIETCQYNAVTVGALLASIQKAVDQLALGNYSNLNQWVDRLDKMDNCTKWIMARRYDSRTTIFSPEGRLYQVEYAMEAISHAGTCLGILASDGILIAAEKGNVHKLLDDSVLAEKIYRLSENITCTVAGITADANILINHLRWWAAQYKLAYGEEMPVEQLVQNLCNEKQRYTQIGGKRPFGVSLLYMGWDKHYGFQLYQSDPSGNYTGWKATCIGNNHQAAVSLLKQEYKTPTLEEAKKLAVKVLWWKTLDVKLAPEKGT